MLWQDIPTRWDEGRRGKERVKWRGGNEQEIRQKKGCPHQLMS